MTSTKLIGLRIYNLLIGRFDFGKKVLRILLESLLVKNKNGTKRYSPCTKFFNINNFK